MYKNYTQQLGVRYLCAPKVLLIMRLTIIILIVSMVQVSANTFAQRISLTEKNAPISKVFKKISQQSGYDFLVTGRLLKNTKPVTINVKDVDVKEVLERILKGQNLKFEIEEKAVIITQALPLEEQKNKQISRADTIDAAGTVLDDKGKPLSGVSVSVKGSYKVTSTNERGIFLLKNVAAKSILRFSYIGYKPKEVPASINTGFVQLELSNSVLDEVQVIAYGQSTQRNNIGSISTVTAKDIEQQPVTNVLQALQGRVPGLSVTQVSGAPGAMTATQIRGQNTIGNTASANSTLQGFNQPLYIVDGVPLANQNKGTQNQNASLGNNGGAGYFANFLGLSPLNSINPMDIESISVLKDADATSIYGSQGSNGVILITTKRGKAGKSQVSLSVQSGPTSASKTAKMMNTQQYLAMRNEAIRNSPRYTPDIVDDADVLFFDQTRDKDWMEEFFGGTGVHTDTHVSVSGGSESTTYLVSGGYTRETYNFPGDFADNRYSLHTSFNHISSDKKFSINFGTDFSYDQNNSTGAPLVLGAFTLAPNFPDFLDANNNLIWNYKGYNYGNNILGNPYAYLKSKANIATYNLNSTFQTSYKILPSLTFAVNAGYNRTSGDQYSNSPIAARNPAFSNNRGSAYFGTTAAGLINIEPQINFSKAISKGLLTVVAGGTYRKQLTSSNLILATGYTSDALLNTVSAAGNPVTASNTGGVYKYLAAFARVNYLWDSKYIVNLTGNRNGSSNFGPNRRYGTFGSAGLGWIVSEEDFLKDNLPFVSFTKLSANYGTSGSDGIGPYQYQANWTVSNLTGGYQGLVGYTPLNPLNPEYGWSTTKKFNQQIELGLFKDRIYLNFSMYQNKTDNQLVSYTLPIQTGFNSQILNAPYSVENKGIEFSLTTKNIDNQNFKWTTSFNISRNRNKLASFDGIESSPYANTFVVGQSISSVRLVPFLGVNPTTGIFEYRKANGTVAGNATLSSGFNNVGGDQTELIDLAPKYIGGLNNTFTYKNFTLSAFFQFVRQQGPNYLSSVYGNFSQPGFALTNLPEAFVNRWQKPGDISSIQRLTSGYNSTVDFSAITAAGIFPYSTGAYSDASYIRLKTVSLGYTLPSSILKKLSLKGCTFYINGQNLFLITGYKEGDPETLSLYNIPPQRTFVAGLNITI